MAERRVLAGGAAKLGEVRLVAVAFRRVVLRPGVGGRSACRSSLFNQLPLNQLPLDQWLAARPDCLDLKPPKSSLSNKLNAVLLSLHSSNLFDGLRL
jgi:hypothetical protein